MVCAPLSPVKYAKRQRQFCYAGHGVNGDEALGHGNWDRSFDVRWQFVKETETLPALAMGLNDFIGTGRYSGEYIFATKNIAPLS